MTESRRSQCVVDNSVLSDLHAEALLRLLGALGLKVFVPDAVYDEYTRIDGGALPQRVLADWNLNVESTDARGVSKVIELVPQYPALSVPDLFALVMAEEKHALLLAGDRNLRKVAEARGATAHGLLWVFDEMVQLTLLDPSSACLKLESIMQVNPRLPRRECDRRLIRWRQRTEAGDGR